MLAIRCCARFTSGYNRAVDWWAVGVLIYEMRCGRSPFEARDQLTMFKNITQCTVISLLPLPPPMSLPPFATS